MALDSHGPAIVGLIRRFANESGKSHEGQQGKRGQDFGL